ncbi:MAG: peptide MFS transporter [Leptospiraceae bacterium]|nr:peptide MFS transporter [Leptospiraceae bacterium]
MRDTHPKGIYILFFTEMWERFSYYGMRALLILYLVKFFKYDDEYAGSIYGAYTGLVYLTPILGGYIADKLIGFKNAIFIGGTLMMCGHISLAFSSIEFFYLGLLLLILGNGFFKPNISTYLGTLYKDKPELKDSGFTIFYMGINLGGMFGPLLCGYLGEVYGWHYGFGLAGVGMFAGLIVFKLGLPILSANELTESKSDLKQTSDELTLEEKSRILVILILSVFTMFFWFAFEQAGSSMNLFADRYMERNLLGVEIPASMFQSFNAFLILLLAPFFARLWTGLIRIDKEPNTTLKFSIAFVLLGIGFLFLVFGSTGITPNSQVKTGMIWLILAYLFQTMGELCISPVGLSMVSKLSPARFGGMLMGTWFLSNAISHYAAGFFSGKMGQFTNLSDFFLIFVYTSFICSIILFLLNKKITTMMHNRLAGK